MEKKNRSKDFFFPKSVKIFAFLFCRHCSFFLCRSLSKSRPKKKSGFNKKSDDDDDDESERVSRLFFFGRDLSLSLLSTLSLSSDDEEEVKTH